ncbi:MAG: response regulator, partial [Deltaproteobacteria bacterium]|nr:response regulator [Deltaproteobacteria bacterium]
MSYRIVVADKDARSREAVQRFLVAEDNTLVGVSTSGELKQAIKAAKPDLIILNSVLQDSPGWHAVHQVVKGIKGSKDYGSIPVLLMTGDPGSPPPAEVKSVGADGYLSKPIDGNALKQTVRSLLGIAPATATVKDEDEEILIDFAEDDSGDMTEELLAMSNIALDAEEASTEVGDTVEIDTGTLVAELDHPGEPSSVETYEDTVRLNLEDMGLEDDFEDSTAFEPTIELVADIPVDFAPSAVHESVDFEGGAAERSVEIELEEAEEALELEAEPGEEDELELEADGAGFDIDTEPGAESVEIDLGAAEASAELDLITDEHMADIELGGEDHEALDLEQFEAAEALPDFSATATADRRDFPGKDSITVDMDVKEYDLDMELEESEETLTEGTGEVSAIDLDDTEIGEILDIQEPSGVLTSEDLQLEDDSLVSAADFSLSKDVIDLEEDSEIRDVELEPLEGVVEGETPSLVRDIDATVPIDKLEMEQWAADDLEGLPLDETEAESFELESALDITGPYEDELSLEDVQGEELTTQEFFGEELPTEEFPTEKFPEEKTRDLKEQGEISLADVDLGGEISLEPEPAEEIPLEEMMLETGLPGEGLFEDYREEEPVLEVTEDISLDEIVLEERAEPKPARVEPPSRPSVTVTTAAVVGAAAVGAAAAAAATNARAQAPTAARAVPEPPAPPEAPPVPPAVAAEPPPPKPAFAVAAAEMPSKAEILELLSSVVGERLGELAAPKTVVTGAVETSVKAALPDRSEVAETLTQAVHSVLPSRQELLDHLVSGMAASIPTQDQILSRVDELVKRALPPQETINRQLDNSLSAALPTAESMLDRLDFALQAIPSREEIEARFEEAMKFMPSADAVLQRVDEALNVMPSREEIDQRFDAAVKALPSTQAVMDRIDEALNVIPSREEIDQRFDAAVKALPSTQAVMDRIDEALKAIPSQQEVHQRFEDAIRAMPSTEAVMERINSALACIPSRDEVIKRFDGAIAEMPSAPEVLERVDVALK